ncbi:MAG: serine hydrolase domain-containing protein, partial [Bacilli bacterium]
MNRLGIMLISMIVSLLVTVTSYAQETTNISAWMTKKKGDYVGAAVITMKDDVMTHEGYYGYANVAKRSVVDERTVFQWGSVSKLLVWSSVMQLVEQGKLQLDEPITSYLPEDFFSRVKYNEPITMMHLMNHTAGWAETNGPTFVYDIEQVDSLEGFLKMYEPEQLFAPGEVVAYSNYGASLAGYIVERVSGQPFWAYVQNHIFDPLGMKETTIHPLKLNNPFVKNGANAVKGYVTPTMVFPKTQGYVPMYPAGAAAGTIRDLAKFAHAIVDEQSVLFQPSTREQLLQATVRFPDGSPRIVHGFFTNAYEETRYGHGGNTEAQSAQLLVEPTKKEVYVAMSNIAGGTTVVWELPAALYGNAPKPSPRTFTEEKDVSGVYLTTRHPTGSYMAFGVWL